MSCYVGPSKDQNTAPPGHQSATSPTSTERAGPSNSLTWLTQGPLFFSFPHVERAAPFGAVGSFLSFLPFLPFYFHFCELVKLFLDEMQTKPPFPPYFFFSLFFFFCLFLYLYGSGTNYQNSTEPGFLCTYYWVLQYRKGCLQYLVLNNQILSYSFIIDTIRFEFIVFAT